VNQYDYEQQRYDAFAPEFETEESAALPLELLRRTALWLGRRPVAGLGIRALRRAEYRALKSLGERLDRAGIRPADPLGNSSPNSDTLPAQIFAELLDASRGTDQQAIEQDFYVRLLRQLNPSQARILVLMADGACECRFAAGHRQHARAVLCIECGQGSRRAPTGAGAELYCPYVFAGPAHGRPAIA
jgi:hypothetical protein